MGSQRLSGLEALGFCSYSALLWLDRVFTTAVIEHHHVSSDGDWLAIAFAAGVGDIRLRLHCFVPAFSFQAEHPAREGDKCYGEHKDDEGGRSMT